MFITLTRNSNFAIHLKLVSVTKLYNCIIAVSATKNSALYISFKIFADGRQLC
jgi:hypothetical protein